MVLHGHLEATTLTSVCMELGRDTHDGSPGPGMSPFQNTTYCKFCLSGNPYRILRKKSLYLIAVELDQPSDAVGLVNKWIGSKASESSVTCSRASGLAWLTLALFLSLKSSP